MWTNGWCNGWGLTRQGGLPICVAVTALLAACGGEEGQQTSSLAESPANKMPAGNAAGEGGPNPASPGGETSVADPTDVANDGAVLGANPDQPASSAQSGVPSMGPDISGPDTADGNTPSVTPMMTADADPSGAMMVDAGTADAAMPPEMHEDQGEGDGRDVVTIGDSWMDYALSGGGIEGGLRRLGKRYRNYSVSGVQFLNGTIPRQYDSAKRAGADIKTVIMTGGGNDILLGPYSCDTAPQCEEYVATLVMGLNELWTKMSNDGVQNVLYINYSRDAGSTPAEARPTMTPVAQICESGPIRCHRLATTDLVMGQLVDGIHPARAANDRIAAAVVELMEEEGLRR